MEPNTRRERDTFSKILSLPICTSCMPNVLSSRRVFQHPRKADFPRVRDSNVWDRKLHEISRQMHDRKYILFFHHPITLTWVNGNMNIANEFQRVISSVLSPKKSFNESRVCERCTKRKLGNLGKILFFFCSLSTFDFLHFLFVFVICIWLIMWYFSISSQLKGLNIRINDLKMHFSILL